MLEGLVANLLNRVLGMYVRNFDPKQLSIGIWGGDVKLRNLELRKEALDQLHLPLNVVEGHLGELTLSIPWSNLRGKPVRVSIEDVFVLAAPKKDAEYDADEEDRRANAVKIEKLENAELMKERNTEGLSQEEQQKHQSFTASLTTAIIDNLQISVKNIHIRYEDSISAPGHPFAVGLTLRDFSAVSTDEDWKPAFIQGVSASSHKLAKLGALAIYWDTDTSLIGRGEGSEVGADKQGTAHSTFLTQIKSMIPQNDKADLGKHQYILKPVSGQAGIEMDKTGKLDRAKNKARLFFDELGFVLDEDQYRDALSLVDLFHYFLRHQEYKRFEPKVGTKEDPRAWIRFAGTAVLDKIHDRNKRWSWSYFKERRDDRQRYIALFKKKKKEEAMSPAETAEFSKLEQKLTYEDLRFWRSLARNQLRKENVGVQKPAQKQGWGSWLFGAKKEEGQAGAADETAMSDQQRSELYNAIDWDEKKAIAEAVDLPKDSIKLQVNMSLKTGSFTLKRDPHGAAVEILKLLFDSFSTSFLQRPESLLLQLSLQGIRLFDGTTPGSLYSEIITIKKDRTVTNGSRITELADTPDMEKAMKLSDDTLSYSPETAFFSMSFEQNPLDGSADSALSVSLKAMEIVYNPAFVVGVAQFFKPPETHMESIGALMESAGATVEGIRKQTRAGLEFALEEHKTINAKLDLQAPLIIIPDSVTAKSTLCLILDAGHASVNSELVDKATINDVHSKQRQALSAEDESRLKHLMYDRFTLKLQSTQVLIGPSIDAARAQLDANEDSLNLHIIDRISMDFLVEICIIPKASDLTKFRITGNLPVLHASISDAKYKNLMRLLDVAIPKFSDDPVSKEVAAGARGPSNLKPSPDKDENSKLPIRRARSTSFQFAALEHDLIMEDDDDSSENFRDASTGEDTSEIAIHQRNFEFKFVVEKLQGSLYRSDPDGKKSDQLLAELVATHFRLDFYQRAFDMVAEVSLGALTLEDHVEESPHPAFKNIVSSEDSSADAKDLFHLRFVKVNTESPEFMTRYEGIGTNLDVSISTINLIVTRRTLLTLLDFVLTTFTTPEVTTTNQNNAKQLANQDITTAGESGPDRIRIRAQLKRIALVLNNDGLRLATLSLNTAHVALTIAGKAMRVGAKLGSFSLVDDVNEGAAIDSPLRQLVTNQGDELADFSYETYDADSDAYPGYDSAIHLKSGSIKVNFVTEPFRKIMDFAVKFGRMQAIFNAARQAAAEQATQIQERANKMHFDILIKTPIVVFPRMVSNDKTARDLLTANLGEIYASNKFAPLDDSESSDSVNQIHAGIRNVRLTSMFYYPGDKSEELELIDKVDLHFDIIYVEHKSGVKRPDLEIQGNLSDINLKISPPQLKLMLGLAQSVPAAFATDETDLVTDSVEHDLPSATVQSSKAITDAGSEHAATVAAKPTAINPELGAPAEKWTKLDLVFKAGAIALELIEAKDGEPVGSFEDASLSKFSLNQTNVKLRMLSDDSLESELLVQSFTIKDTRKRETNKFRKIMSLINTDVSQQFMATITLSGGTERDLLLILSIDSPRIILALEYIFAVQTFLNNALISESTTPVVEEAFEEDASHDGASVDDSTNASRTQKTIESPAGPTADATETANPEGSMAMSFRVNLVDAQVILLANPGISSSEAIVLSMKQAIVAKQHATTLQVEKVGMFLCRMDKFDNSRLRVLDDFSISTSLDVRSRDEKSSITNISVEVEPLVLRLSLRDVLLVMQIVSKASELSNSNDSTANTVQSQTSLKPAVTSTQRRKSSNAAGKSAQSIKTMKRDDKPLPLVAAQQGSTILKREEMNVRLGGMRIVLIGDLHELPMLDWSVNEFSMDIRDWSGALTAETNIDMFLNVYNFSKSSWEPFMEPWSLGFHVSREQTSGRLAIDLYSRKSLELSITSATIALFSKSFQFLSTDEDVLSKPRGTDAPYRIRNYTGFPIDVWAQTHKGEDGAAAKLVDGEECPWRFEDPTITRETLAPEGASGVVGVRLEGSGFDSVDRIPVNREGEAIYALPPRKDKVLHRLLVEVKLGADRIKYITFRSPLSVENNTQIPIEIGVYSPDEGHLLKVEKIAPGEARPSPVGAAFMHALVVRPDQGFGYIWSNEHLFWKDVLKRPTSTITCRGDQDDAPPFYFQMNAVFDKNDPLTSVYPYMRIRISAPIELQNLLPYDFKYKIYDKHTKKDCTNFLRKGGVSPVHMINLSHLLLLNLDLQDTAFRQSEFVIVNSPDREYSREKVVTVKDSKDLALRLKLHYFNVPDSGGAFRITVYSPYIILNRTGLELDVRSKTFLGAAKAAAGQGVFANVQSGEAQHATPFMFSFPSDDQKNRALLKVGDSSWSKPQSFNALGSNYDVTLSSSVGRGEMQVGVTVSQGEGKYKLTNVITIAPRFVVKNKIGEDLQIREPGNSETTSLKTGALHAMRFMRQTTGQQLSLCFPGLNNQWSSPFNIANVGTVHVKLAKDKQRQQLIRAEILLENATIFIHLSLSTHWPFSMRNESSQEFFFYQANPNMNEDEEDRSSGWRPIRYRLPPRSIMPYAWDYPASKNKDLILNVGGKERTVKLAEIGQQLPFKLGIVQGRQRIIDIEVIADGPRQNLVLSDYKQSQSLYKPKGSSANQSNAGFEVKEQDTDVTFRALIRLAGVGISLVNRVPRELLYVTFRDIEVKYNESALYQTVNWTTKWIQIDNQLYGGIFPILLYPSVVPKTGKEMEAHPIFHTAITRVKDDSYGVLYVKYFTFLLQQMTFEIDEDFIFALIDFAKIPGAAWSEEKEGKLFEGELDIPEPQQEEHGKDVYFELLHLQPMQIDLSFVRTERINAEDTMAVNNPFMFAVNVLTMSLGNINDAPLRYNALMIENARITPAALIANIQSHYVQESLRQVHIVLGSADFLGNPVGLFNNISSGVADIFYEPYQGLVMTDRPQDLGIGIAKGASSFVKKSVFGFSDSMAKITGSMSKGLAAATLDKEFQDQRRMSRARNRPKHALYGITSGGNAFANSLASGIGGLARQPFEGAEKEGLPGFVKGVGKGLLGFATKPAIGVFDLASNLAEGVRNTTTVFDQEGLDRVRLTRFIGQDGIVRPFSQREALGQFWLKTLDNGKYFNENYIAHLELPGKDMLTMLTYNSIMLVRTKKMQTEWDVPLRDIAKISKERTGMNITFKEGRNGPFIPVQDEGSRNWLYKQLGVAVNAYNEKWQAKG